MDKTKSTKYKIILASGSPRRQQFFKDLDLNYEIRLKEIEEIYPDNLRAEEITNYLAELKASAFEGELLENEIASLTKEKETVTHKLNNGDTPFEELQVLSQRIGEVTRLLDEKELRWLELSEMQ